MTNKRPAVLLVGSSGFLGRAVLAAAVEAGMTPTLLNRSRQAGYPGQQRILSEMERLPDAFDVVVNLAAHIPYGKVDVFSEELFEVNVRLPFDLARQFPAAHHVYASTVSAYAVSSPQPTDEQAATSPCNVYAASKLAGECLIRAVANCTVLRFSSLYGVGMRPLTFLPILVKTALGGVPLTLFGDGQRRQDYLHVRDAARMVLAATERPQPGLYNAVNGCAISNLELAQTVAALVPGTAIVFRGADASPSCCYSGHKFQAAFEMKPEVSLQEGLKEMVHHGA